VAKNCVVAAEITLKCLHVAYNYYFRFTYVVNFYCWLHMSSREVSTRVNGSIAHENMDIAVNFFPSAARVTRVTLETSFHHLGCPLFPTKIWGTITDMEKVLGFSANIFLEKVTEAFQTIRSRFGAVGRKPVLGKLPPLAIGGLRRTRRWSIG